ncbi:MAG: 50S ribosomal protein L3 [Rickettsiaceae bacterium]|nr:50S ribosomal protein L3 [Rickettsiaceae bacterium]
MRTGLVVEKLGSTSLFLESGERTQVTLLKMEISHVVERKTEGRDGYSAVILGYGEKKLNKVKKPEKKLFENANVPAKKILKEFRVSEDNLLAIGTELNVDHFASGQFIDVKGISKGKGFAGAMKRHNFRGLEATHGVSITHRSHGSTGGRQDPGRVFKNKKMAGHLGDEKVTILNLKIMDVKPEERLIIVKGSVPGKTGSILYIRDSIKK